MSRQRIRDLVSAWSARFRRAAGLILACALLLAAGGLAALAHGGAPRPTVRAGSAAPAMTAPEGTPTAITAPTAATEAVTTPSASSPATPTLPPYTGPNDIQVTIDRTSCLPGADSPYPYLDLVNASKDTTLDWQVTVSDPSFSLYHNPPHQVLPGWSDFIAFIGPATASRPLTVTFTGNIGYWSGTLQPCAVATPLPPPPMSITITCATASAAIDAKLCVHVEALPATVTAVVTYCDGTKEGDYALSVGTSTDNQGNVVFDWIPNTTCYGPATATVSAENYEGRHGTATTTFTVTGPPIIRPTDTPVPPPTPTPTSSPTP